MLVTSKQDVVKKYMELNYCFWRPFSIVQLTVVLTVDLNLMVS